MAHIEQRNFCTKVKAIHPKHFYNVNVLDIGSLDVNGSNSFLFTGNNTTYMGIDVVMGKNVHAVSKGHEWSAPDGCYDTIISTECFEHDPYYELTFKNIVRMLKSGGMFIFTCATTGREVHGIAKGLTSHPAWWGDHYKNLVAKDIRGCIDVDAIFKEYLFEVNDKSCDLYFYGIKK